MKFSQQFFILSDHQNLSLSNQAFDFNQYDTEKYQNNSEEKYEEKDRDKKLWMIVANRLLLTSTSSGKENEKGRERGREKNVKNDLIVNVYGDYEKLVVNKERKESEIGITEDSSDKIWASEQAKKMLLLLKGSRTITRSFCTSFNLFFCCYYLSFRLIHL